LSMMSQRPRSASHTMKKFTPSKAVDNYISFWYNKNLVLKHMCNFKGFRRLCPYIILYLNAGKLTKIAKLGHGRYFLQSILR